MPFMEWSDKLSVGVDSIDVQHQRLVMVLNELFDALGQGKGADKLRIIVDSLLAYVAMHFAYEERLMARAGFPGLDAHKREHEDLTKKVLAIHAKLKSGAGFDVAIELVELLKNWLIHHIMISDKKYTPYMLSKQMK